MDYFNLERSAVNPTFTITPGQRTKVAISYERRHDRRLADPRITSFQGPPADVEIETSTATQTTTWPE